MLPSHLYCPLKPHVLFAAVLVALCIPDNQLSAGAACNDVSIVSLHWPSADFWSLKAVICNDALLLGVCRALTLLSRPP